MWFQTCISWTQKKIFWRMWVTKKFLVAIGFRSILSTLLEVNGDQQLFHNNILQNNFFCVQQKNKIHSFETWRWVNDDKIWIFWVNYHFCIDTLLLLHNCHSNYTFICTFESYIAVQALFWFKLIILYIFIGLWLPLWNLLSLDLTARWCNVSSSCLIICQDIHVNGNVRLIVL